MKKVIIIFTAALCLCATYKAMSQTITSGTTGDCTWTLTGTTGNYTLTISGNGVMENYLDSSGSIPWYSYRYGIKTLHIQQGVTIIGNHAFPSCIGLTSVTIGSSVTAIGEGAFENCSSLTSITIPNSVTTIGNYAFSICNSLASVTIPNSVTSIGDYAFSLCYSLASITIPSSVTTIGHYVFFGCIGLTSVTIPHSVTSIGYNIFYDCVNLTNIDVAANNAHYSSANGILFNKSQSKLVQYPVGKTGSYTIPHSVTSIGQFAFFGCNGLTSITIPNSVTTIEKYAFLSCSYLTSITVPDSVTMIGEGAFRNCTSLSTVNFNAIRCVYAGGDSVSLFSNCPFFTNLTTGNNVQSIPDYVFSSCYALTSATLGNSVKTIGNCAFYYCSNLASVTIPDSVTSIGDSAFSNCGSLTSVVIPHSVAAIGDYAFSDCNNLASVSIGDSVATIGTGAFCNCNALTNIDVGVNNAFYCSVNGILFNKSQDTLRQYPAGKGGSYAIPVSVTMIGNAAFQGCHSLTSVIIPHSVTAIGGAAFFGCNGLAEIYVKAQTPPALHTANVFGNVLATTPVYTPCGTAAAYQSASGWNYFSHYTDSLLSANITVESDNPAMGTVNITQPNTCANDTAIITAVANAGYRFVQWNDGNTENPRNITVTQDTSFTAMFDDGVGTTELETSAVAVYPNPATDNIIISLREMITDAVFTLYDMQGKVLIRQKIANEDMVSVNNLAAGIYIYNVSTAKGTVNGKVVVVNNE
jgi:hypothetical protein